VLLLFTVEGGVKGWEVAAAAAREAAGKAGIVGGVRGLAGVEREPFEDI
jgi:hypothetical protein